MATDFHTRVGDVIDAALRRRTSVRAAFIGEIAKDDRAVLREALSLLPHYVDVAESELRDPHKLKRWLPGIAMIAKRADGFRDDLEWKIPFSIPPYSVVELIGRGGMGIVYRGRNPLRNSDVAIKLLRRRVLSHGDRRRFKHEAELLRRLRHCGIVRLLHSGITQLVDPASDGSVLEMRPFIVMEFVRGVSLSEFSESRGLSAPQRLILLAAVCRAVEYAHRRGIIHRDLKPDNILVDDTGMPKILDFGIARLQSAGPDAAGQTGHFAGTPAYASPEQFAGCDAALTAASDVYSLGLIAHELLTGRLPTRSRGRAMVDLRNVYLPEPRRRLSQAQFRHSLTRLLSTTLNSDREQRYAHAGEFAADLTELCDACPQDHRSDILRKLARFVKSDDRSVAATHGRLLATSLRRRIDQAMDEHPRG